MCHCIISVFRVLGIYNFVANMKWYMTVYLIEVSRDVFLKKTELQDGNTIPFAKIVANIQTAF